MDYVMLVSIPFTGVPDDITEQEARVTAETWLGIKIPEASLVDFQGVVPLVTT